MTTAALMDRPSSTRTRVLARATVCLKDRLLALAKGIRAEFAEGMLILSGEVRSFHQKQQAQEAVRGVADVEQVVNRIRVVRSR